ncbi:hypothetical protein C8J56DRAFT_968743 [Mycena floridula]|nr:hypothetical protein C8J56DRAFT_968743 [Mycena floridula]
MTVLLKHDDCIFARSHLPSLVQQSCPTERSVSAALDIISSLAGNSLFPYNLVHKEQVIIWYGDVIPIAHLFFRLEFLALSSVFDRTKFLTILQCSEDLTTLDRPRLPEEYFPHVWEWIYGIAHVNSIPWGEGVDEFKRSLSWLNPSPYPRRPLDMPELKTALACCTLSGLCDFVLKEMSRDAPNVESIANLPIYRCVQLTSFLARGSPQQQQVYASAILVTTSAFAHHSETLAKDPSFSELQYNLVRLLQPLVYITDVDALQTVRKTLSSRAWWQDVFVATQVIQVLQPDGSGILRDPVIAPMYWVKRLFALFSWGEPPEAFIASHLQQRPSTLTGCLSELQNDFVRYISYFETGNITSRRQLAAALFSLAGTLDDAEAATIAMKYFEEYIPQFDELYHDLDQTKKDQHFLDAKEALKKLKQKANEPGFIYKALSLRLEE